MKNSTIIHIPHASVEIPDRYRSTFVTPNLDRETAVMTDWFCDELFDCGRERIVFPVSRLVCDVERFRDDAQEIMSRVGMGAVYERCSDGSPLRTVSEEQKRQILRSFYDAHHGKLTAAVREKLRQYGRCIIIDAHSFYPLPLPHEPDQSGDRPDFCIGTSEYHTPPAVTEALRTLLESRGYCVKIDSPFAGTIVPMEFYLRDRRVVSVMIEVNRSLYLSVPGVKNSAFSAVRDTLRDCVEYIEAAF